MYEDLRARAMQLLAELHGAEPENAVCAIRALPSEALSFLAEGYRREPDGARRQSIIHALWESRNAATLPTLGLALNDSDDRVWREALDGIVALGGTEALQILDRVRQALPHRPESLAKRDWINEAIEQVQRETSTG